MITSRCYDFWPLCYDLFWFCRSRVLNAVVTRAVTVLDFVLPRWSSNKYRGYAVNRTTPPPPPPPPVQFFFDMVALVQMHGLLLLRAAEPQHIVAGVRFHWSREEKHFQRKRFIEPTLSASARARRCTSRTEHTGGFGFQTKVKDCFLNQRRWHK